MAAHLRLWGAAVFGEVAAELRQWRFPAPLRIAPASHRWSDVPLAGMGQAWQQVERALDRQPEPGAPDFSPELVKVLVTTFWRLDRQVATMPESSESRTLRNRLRQLTGLMKTHGIQVYDYSGKTYDPDEIWDDVVADESRKADPMIVGMREPRIVYRGELLQRGTPIVEDRTHRGGDE